MGTLDIVMVTVAVVVIVSVLVRRAYEWGQKIQARRDFQDRRIDGIYQFYNKKFTEFELAMDGVTRQQNEECAEIRRNIDQVVRNANDDTLTLAQTLEKELAKVDARIDAEVADWRMQMAEAIVTTTLNGKRK